MKIATWNVNSVRQRTDLVCDWLRAQQPDLLLLQEIKCEEPSFPGAAFAALGYQSVVVGQKSYNGVAVLSREPVEVMHRFLPALPPTPDGAPHQARYLEVRWRGVLFGNLYLPNGNSGGEAGYAAKLAWMEALLHRARELLAADEDFVMAGDYNVCPTDADFAPGTLSGADALMRPETRRLFQALRWAGMTDAVRALRPREKIYSFWDYQAGCWPRDMGLRIDHAMLSPRMAERLEEALPDRMERDKPQPSDHVPVMVTFSS
ncbi:exodeoxyribonuclease III [Rhizosaccharibacter radicis]|uniref:Exodeoxyribonuclease III n=1 Tax=Rhizosaccharibacter radicis TaxID=2782605 RepID=A0ABT1VW82_9PROT|nr:exodeoxyribonuclease III [Acetobacteraceae bacterium KSS12]